MMQRSQWHAPSRDPIRQRTSDASNARIDRATRRAIDEFDDSPERIRARLHQLDREWDVDRALMLNFAILGTITASLTIRGVHRTGRLGGWALLLGTQLSFLAYHAIRRWCPPMPVFRRLGFRSDREICAERSALEKRLAEIDGR